MYSYSQVCLFLKKEYYSRLVRVSFEIEISAKRKALHRSITTKMPGPYLMSEITRERLLDIIRGNKEHDESK